MSLWAKIIVIVGSFLFAAILTYLSLKGKIPRVTTIIMVIFFVLIVISMLYLIVREEIEKKYEVVFVVPSSYVIQPGMDEEFTMKVTNNYNYPLYKVQVKISLEYGDLPLEDVLISSTSDEKIPGKLEIISRAQLYKGPPKDAIRIKVFNDNGRIRLIELYVRTKEGDIYKIFFIEHMDAHDTKNFPLKIHKNRCEKKSKISFKIRGSSKNPVPTYMKPGELKIVIPKEGHH